MTTAPTNTTEPTLADLEADERALSRQYRALDEIVRHGPPGAVDEIERAARRRQAERDRADVAEALLAARARRKRLACGKANRHLGEMHAEAAARYDEASANVVRAMARLVVAMWDLGEARETEQRAARRCQGAAREAGIAYEQMRPSLRHRTPAAVELDERGEPQVSEWRSRPDMTVPVAGEEPGSGATWTQLRGLAVSGREAGLKAASGQFRKAITEVQAA